jgi:hypothetical protein
MAFAASAKQDQADQNWTEIRSAIDNDGDVGGREAQVLLGNAFAWTRTSDVKLLRRGLQWIAAVPTTNDTSILGAAWLYPGGDPPPPPSSVITMQGQPHVPSMAQFYLAALKTYGSKNWSQN